MKKTILIKEDIHFRVLHALDENPSMTQRELASLLNVSLGRVNFLIKALVEIGHIKLKNFEKNPNKMSYFYLLTPQGILKKSNLTSQFLKRKIKEYEFLKKEIESLGGQLWYLITSIINPKSRVHLSEYFADWWDWLHR